MTRRIPFRWFSPLLYALLLGLLAGCPGEPRTETESDEATAEPTAPAPEGTVSALDFAQVALADVAPNEWQDPEEIVSVDGVLEAAFAVTLRSGIPNPYGGEPDLTLRTYRVTENGRELPFKLVGPTLRFRAGDELRMTLGNELAASENVADRTNFHTHGLHISPGCHGADPPCAIASDNVLLDLQPGQGQRYRFDILPAGTDDSWKHYPGTFWYHAHRHGSTSTQVASGMAGALILEDEEEMEELNLSREQERLFILQQLAFDANGKVESVDDLRTNWQGKSTTINGVVKPYFTMHPGEVERWRLVGAGIFETINFGIVAGAGEQPSPPALHLIAIDGITLKKRRVVERYELGPGYRADLVVKAPDEPGVYRLVKDRSTLVLGLGESTDTASQLAELRVEGEHCDKVPGCRGELPPEDLPHPMEDVTEVINPDDPRSIVFDVQGGKFLINGEEYDKNRVDQTMKLGTAEAWALRSARGNHPFHIHVNAFQLVDGDDFGDWHDTIIAPSSTVAIRTRYERFTGKFVLHCHILDHEDKGMMQLVEITP